ncbi:MAG: hypothetical protein IPP77_03505 [Bacteroidetes bacterium]|nr:hypothetical protein [Bacteroidota bacterium]
MTKIPEKLYDISQADLYATLHLLLTNYRAKQSQLAAFMGKYTIAWGNDFEAEIEAAEALPDRQQRGEMSETLRLEMLPLHETCLNRWQDLKRYISSAYPEYELKPKFEAAGSKYYSLAVNFNWEDAKTMHLDAIKFMTNHSAALEMGGENMPAGFPALYNADYQAWLQKYNLFMPARQTTQATVQKINANNDLFRKRAMKLCADAQACFRKNPAIAQLFVWAILKRLVTPPKDSTLIVKILLAESDTPASGALFVWTNKKTSKSRKITADKTGVIVLKKIPHTLYLWQVSLEGRATVSGKKRIKTGVHSRLTVRLKS